MYKFSISNIISNIISISISIISIISNISIELFQFQLFQILFLIIFEILKTNFEKAFIIFIALKILKFLRILKH